ncbi:hypothetical protein SAMN05216436_106140 [bacterium A37T11]|nr:hypothetical protein SAMN05216436_106140 [bacterium A37T11]
MKEKCRVTGKTRYESHTEARVAMEVLRMDKPHYDISGKRVKHRQGQPKQIRYFYCRFCGGYHLTKWRQKEYRDYNDREGIKGV